MHSLLPLLAEAPAPRDLMLPLPLDLVLLKVLAVALFLLHILFVNVMVGGTVMSVVFEITGLKFPRYDTLARRIGETVTVNKSLAVVFGIGPLLVMNLLYTAQFYAANSLTGIAWALVIPLVITAFLLTYAHKYTWDTWTGRRKPWHIALGLAALLLFLAIPFIFLANINLMLFPDKWAETRGFFASLRVGNVFPRYFHFIAASVAVTGLFLAGWFGRRRFRSEGEVPGFTVPELRRHFFGWAFFVTLAQFVFGPFVLFTLPEVGLSTLMVTFILVGAALASVPLYLMYREMRARDADSGRLYWPIMIFFFSVVCCMAQGRHLYRENALADHKAAIARKTAEFRGIELATAMNIKAGLGAGESLTAPPSGKKIFAQTCAACHRDVTPVGAPSLVEIHSLYRGRPEGIVKWASAPGKKREQYPQMPAFAHLGAEQLDLVARYMLERAEKLAQPGAEAPAPAGLGAQKNASH